jgi:hypothetical protein
MTGLNLSMTGSAYTPHSLSPHDTNSMSTAPPGGKDLLMEYYPFVTKGSTLSIYLFSLLRYFGD